ncbi:hypothetical protein P5673_013804 [Acropora cervicornis]|uniref:Uncharacterized protein n=1 Tax=Acropora cervicornis TaxID=6130 RepID=A0AAD9V699_ACRCE|nr:hypothetical protein P5673_013804 [Acropora cervicornis]
MAHVLIAGNTSLDEVPMNPSLYLNMQLVCGFTLSSSHPDRVPRDLGPVIAYYALRSVHPQERESLSLLDLQQLNPFLKKGAPPECANLRFETAEGL